MEPTVYLRHNPKKMEYHLTIPSDLKFENIVVDHEIEIVCPEDENIGFLLAQAKKEIVKSIRNKSKTDLNLEPSDIEIFFRRQRQTGFRTIPDELDIKVIVPQDHRKSRLAIFDTQYCFVVNHPKITDIVLPPVIYASYRLLPVKIEGMHLQISLCDFKWYKSADGINWGETIGTGFEYITKKDQVGYYFKVVCVPKSPERLTGCPFEAVSTSTLVEVPEVPECPFESRHVHTQHTLSDQRYRVVSYNILSRRYTHQDDTYAYCPPEFLVIDYRKQLILKEIIGYNADILCLQEVDHIEYNDFFKQGLENAGYITKFFRKGFYLPEGSMIAIRKTRLKLKSYDQIVLSHAVKNKDLYKEIYAIIKSDKKMKKKLALQCTSLMIFLVKCQDKRYLLVGNIHLSHHPDNDDTRLIHTFMAIRYLKSRKEKLQRKYLNFKVNIVICGDFNSQPYSVIYNFIRTGSVPYNDSLIVAYQKLRMEHDLKFQSACGTPKFTVYTPTFKGCLDYIFFEEDEADILDIVPFMEEEVEKEVGLPNKVYPSDHLALVADIEFRIPGINVD